MATGFYTQLLGRLEEHYSLPVTSMDHSQLIGMAHTLGHVFFCVCFSVYLLYILFVCFIICTLGNIAYIFGLTIVSHFVVVG